MSFEEWAINTNFGQFQEDKSLINYVFVNSFFKNFRFELQWKFTYIGSCFLETTKADPFYLFFLQRVLMYVVLKLERISSCVNNRSEAQIGSAGKAKRNIGRSIKRGDTVRPLYSYFYQKGAL